MNIYPLGYHGYRKIEKNSFSVCPLNAANCSFKMLNAIEITGSVEILSVMLLGW